MGKKKKSKRRSSKEKPVEPILASGSPLAHRPFAGLSLPVEKEALGSRTVPVRPAVKPRDESEHTGDAPRDDGELLARELADVMPLGHGQGIVAKPPAPKPMLAEADEDMLVMRHLDELVHGELPFDFADTDEYIEAAVSDLDRRVVRRLRRGEYAIQAHLDLHGLNREEARMRVAKFVRECHLVNLRCVLIVHGRGIGSKDNIPVIKNKLRAWLTRGAIGKKVLAFTSAQPFDGGTGAVYVLLRG